MAKTLIICITTFLSLLVLVGASLFIRYEKAGYISFNVNFGYSNYTEDELNNYDITEGI